MTAHEILVVIIIAALISGLAFTVVTTAQAYAVIGCLGQVCNNDENTQSNNINWESLCNSYGSLVGLNQPCNYYAHGTQLTPAGKQALLCLFGGGLPALINPSVTAAARELASRSNTICP